MTALDSLAACTRACLIASATARLFTGREVTPVEIQHQLEAVCGWGLRLWIRLEGLRGRVDAAGRNL